jgi:hypothetical protein
MAQTYFGTRGPPPGGTNRVADEKSLLLSKISFSKIQEERRILL